MIGQLIHKQIEFVFVNGDENAFNGIKNISSKALIEDKDDMQVTIQVSANTPTNLHNIVSCIYNAFGKDNSVQLNSIDVHNCKFTSRDNIRTLSCILNYIRF